MYGACAAAAAASSMRPRAWWRATLPRLARLISHEFELARAPEALRFAMGNPDAVMKVVIHGE